MELDSKFNPGRKFTGVQKIPESSKEYIRGGRQLLLHPLLSKEETGDRVFRTSNILSCQPLCRQAIQHMKIRRLFNFRVYFRILALFRTAKPYYAFSLLIVWPLVVLQEIMHKGNYISSDIPVAPSVIMAAATIDQLALVVLQPRQLNSIYDLGNSDLATKDLLPP